MKTFKLTTASGKPLCRYALGGAARSVQPKSLPLKYRDLLSCDEELGSPFYFYYNPHRYPAFLSGVAASFTDDGPNKVDRRDVFIASGGSDRGVSDIDQRVEDALKFSGGYLDAFVLEYICPEELLNNNPGNDDGEQLTLQDKVTQTCMGTELETALAHLRSLVAAGTIRYILASTHSHFVGAVLCNAKVQNTSSLDGIMLRYNMAHKRGAELLSFPYALDNDIPVIAFTTTRWNRLLNDNPHGDDMNQIRPPTTADCIKFALQHPAVEVVLHSARDEEELGKALQSLIKRSSDGSLSNWLPVEKCNAWVEYGADERKWNEADEFDEYPEESQ